MRRIALALTLCALVPGVARAGSFSAVDGSVLGPSTQATTLWMGYPTLGVRYLQGQPQQFDFGYGLILDYMRASAEPQFNVRWSLVDRQDYNVALRGDLGLHLDAGWDYADRTNAPNAGVRMTPGLAVGMHPHPSYSSFFTLEVPFLWTFGYGGGWRLPVLMGMGMEYAMTPDLNFVFYGNLGPRFEGGGGYVGGVFFQLEVWMGLTFRLF